MGGWLLPGVGAMEEGCKLPTGVQYSADMAKQSGELPAKDLTAFANNPFAKLARDSAVAARLPSVLPAPAAAPIRRPQTSLAPRLTMRHESVGRSGKVVTRISGVPVEMRGTVAARLGKALGCTAEVEGGEVILAGSLKERAAEWVEKIGDLRKLADEKPTPAATSRPAPSRPALVATTASGTYRRNVRPGMRVGVVMKDDQPIGELTMGVVRDLLTSSEEHSRGIKVRLVSGQVGRVKVIYH
ncbi:MAG TPA: YwbE family protein [Polyangia bacterium]